MQAGFAFPFQILRARLVSRRISISPLRLSLKNRGSTNEGRLSCVRARNVEWRFTGAAGVFSRQRALRAGMDCVLLPWGAH